MTRQLRRRFEAVVAAIGLARLPGALGAEIDGHGPDAWRVPTPPAGSRARLGWRSLVPRAVRAMAPIANLFKRRSEISMMRRA